MKLHGENQYCRVCQMGTVSVDTSISSLCILGVEGGRGGSSRERAGVVPPLFISVHRSCHLTLRSWLPASSASALCTPVTPTASSRQRGWACPHCAALGPAPGSPGLPGSPAVQRQQHRTPLSRRNLPGAGQWLVDPAVMAIPSDLQFTRHCYLYSTLMPRLKSLTVG